MAGHREIDSKNMDELTLIRQAQEGVKKALAVLRDRYSNEVDCCIRRHATSDAHVEAIAQAAWEDLQLKLSVYDPDHLPFPTFVKQRTSFIMLKHYAAPERRDAVLIETLSRELREVIPVLELDEECAELLLVLRIQADDREAFNQVWACHEKAILGRIRGCIRGRIRPREDVIEVAKEIRDETYIALSNALKKSYDPNIGRFRPFAQGYAENLTDHFFAQRWKVSNREPSIADITPKGSQDNDPQAWETRIPAPGQTVEEILIKEEAAKRRWQIVFNSSSPPHQVIIFGFNRLLGQRPRAIVTQLSNDILRTLETRLEQDLMEDTLCGENVIADCFQKLRKDMNVTFGSLVQHPKTRAVHKALLQRITGDTVLREFYTTEDDPEDDIRKWSNNVLKSVKEKLLEEILGSFPEKPLREKRPGDTQT